MKLYNVNILLPVPVYIIILKIIMYTYHETIQCQYFIIISDY